MRTLVIPDIHHHTANAEHWLTSQKYDRVVFLGDYFDDYDDSAADATATAHWLRNRMDRTEDVFLLGNHDAPYMFPKDEDLYCPGFTQAKAEAIEKVLKPEHWHRLKLAHLEQGWLLSHAGFHPAWMKDLTVEKVVVRCELAMERARSGIVDPILGEGELPKQLQKMGGPLWMDWSCLSPILGINQIVGHTSGDEVRITEGPDSINYCLDVNFASSAAILEDGVIQILPR